jgi:hypothetical protein
MMPHTELSQQLAVTVAAAVGNIITVQITAADAQQ